MTNSVHFQVKYGSNNISIVNNVNVMFKLSYLTHF